jgi:hypothetical protein
MDDGQETGVCNMPNIFAECLLAAPRFAALFIVFYLLHRPRTPLRRVLAIGINRNMPARWMREMKQSETRHMKAFTGRGNERDEETARLRKEIVDMRETNEVLKKAMAVFTEPPAD